MAIHSSILAWEIPRKEKPGGLQSKGLQRVEQRERKQKKKNARERQAGGTHLNRRVGKAGNPGPRLCPHGCSSRSVW